MHTISEGKFSMMPMSATPLIKFPVPSKTMLQTADRCVSIVRSPSVRMPSLPVSSVSSRPKPSLPTGETRRVEWASGGEGPDSTR